MSIARYKWAGNFTDKDLDDQIPTGFTGVIQQVGPEVFADIEVLPDLTGAKDDLDAYMATLGWTFVVEDPTTPTSSVNQSVSVYDATGGQEFSGSIVVLFDTVQKNTAPSIFSFNAATGEITVLETGTYLIIFDVTLTSTTNTQTTSQSFLERNAVLVPGTESCGYHRNSSNGDDTASMSTSIDLVANDVLRVTAQKMVGSTLATVANGSRLTLERTK